MEYPIKDSVVLPRGWLTGLLGLDLASRLFVAFRPLRHLDSLMLPDDAYYSLSIARAIAEGFSPIHGLEPTNGFQPLYVFLMTPVFLFTGQSDGVAVHAALVLLSGFDLLALYFIIRIVSSISRSRATPLLAALLWIFNPYVLRTTMNGLETMIALALALMSLHEYYRLRASDSEGAEVRASVFVGALLGLTILARIDHLLFAAPLIGIHALRGGGAKGRPARLAEASIMGMALLAVNLPWLAYSLYFTGDLYPISGRAVRLAALARVGFEPTLENAYGPAVRTALDHIFWSNAGPLIVLGALCAVGISLRRRGLKRGIVRWLGFHAPLLVFGFALVSAYVFYVLAEVFFHRYFFALIAILILAACAVFEAVHGGLTTRGARRALAIGFLSAAALAPALQPRHGAFPRLSDFYFSKATGAGYMPLGRWAADYFEPGTVVGSTQSGALGYFARDLVVYNLDGVVNKACYEALSQRRLMSYIKEQKISYILVWSDNVAGIMRQSRDFKHGDLISMGMLQGVRTWGYEWFVYRINYEN